MSSLRLLTCRSTSGMYETGSILSLHHKIKFPVWNADPYQMECCVCYRHVDSQTLQVKQPFETLYISCTKHTICSDCAVEWASRNPSCPVCRKEWSRYIPLATFRLGSGPDIKHIVCTVFSVCWFVLPFLNNGSYNIYFISSMCSLAVGSVCDSGLLILVMFWSVTTGQFFNLCVGRQQQCAFLLQEGSVIGIVSAAWVGVLLHLNCIMCRSHIIVL